MKNILRTPRLTTIYQKEMIKNLQTSSKIDAGKLIE